MDFLFYSIIINVWIFLAFKSFQVFHIPTLPAVVVNYFVCALVGFIFLQFEPATHNPYQLSSWIWIAILLGVIFIITFYTIAKVTQQSSISVATIASRMSMVIPVLFALFVFKYEDQPFGIPNYVGLALAFVSVILSTVTSQSRKTMKRGKGFIYLPLLIFVLQGSIDAIINYANSFLVPSSASAIFPIFIFLTAGIIGMTYVFTSKQSFNLKSIIGGLYLGIPNYFSIYFLIKALSSLSNNGALVFPILNTGIIVIGSISAFLFFKETISKTNLIGIIIALIAIFLISYQELVLYLPWI